MQYLITRLTQEVTPDVYTLLGTENNYYLLSTEASMLDIDVQLQNTPHYIIGRDSDEVIKAEFGNVLDYKMLEISMLAEAERVELVSKYLPIERETWEEQKQDAIKFLEWYNSGEAGIAPETLLLSAFAEVRGKTVLEVALSIVENAKQFSYAVGRIQGRQYALLDVIKASTTLSEAFAVEWK